MSEPSPNPGILFLNLSKNGSAPEPTPVLLLPAAKLDGTGIAFNIDDGLVESGGVRK